MLGIESITMEFLNHFKQYYEEFDQRSIDELDQFYSQEVRFSDPIHTLYGISALKAYFIESSSALTYCRFEFVEECVSDNKAWYQWVMYYQHPRLAKGKKLSVSGVSLIAFSNTETGVKISSHEDFYDVATMLYQHIPVLGGIIAWIKNKMSKDHQ